MKKKRSLKFDSGCTGWQNTSQIPLKINLANPFDWLQKQFGKKQKLILRHPSAKEHDQSEKDSKNVLSLILGTLFRGVRSKIQFTELAGETSGKEKKSFRKYFL